MGLTLLENGVGGLERLHPPRVCKAGGPSSPQGVCGTKASQEEVAQRDLLGFSQAKPCLFPILGSALEVF